MKDFSACRSLLCHSVWKMMVTFCSGSVIVKTEVQMSRTDMMFSHSCLLSNCKITPSHVAKKPYAYHSCRRPMSFSRAKILAFSSPHSMKLSNWTNDYVGKAFDAVSWLTVHIPRFFLDKLNHIMRRHKDNGCLSTENRPPYSQVNLYESNGHDSVKFLTASLKNHQEMQLTNVMCNYIADTLKKNVNDVNESISSSGNHKTFINTVPLLQLSGNDEMLSEKVEDKDVIGWNIFRKIGLPVSLTESRNLQSDLKKPVKRMDFISRSSIESRTRSLISCLKAADSTDSSRRRIQMLSEHLNHYPSNRGEATELKVLPHLLKLIRHDPVNLGEDIMELLALLGYQMPVSGHGIRILSLDGGGVRGLMTIQCLKKIERISERNIYELFDYVCGVSTGALIGAMVCLYRFSLDKCEQMYVDFSKKMFDRNLVMGTGGLVWNHAFYNSDQWETLLQTAIGRKTLIEFARDPLVPKFSAVSTVMNMPHLKNYVFRNYNLPPEAYSHFPGNCTDQLWQVIRASSAAPGYYEDFPLGEFVHSDGGLLTNNPTSVAIHEARLLWPHEDIQCVVSLGTGRYEPNLQLTTSSAKVTLKEKLMKIIDSATDTEAVHVMMSDLLPSSTYFRFNPYLSENVPLDETRQDRVDGMLRDTEMYLRKNESKMVKVAQTLQQGRTIHQRALDWLRLKADTIS